MTFSFGIGSVHCDPHPGNLLARPMAGGRNGDAQLVLLDHGMYRELQPAFRREYSRLWVSLLTRDHESGRRAAAALGVRSDDYDALSLLLTFRSSTSARALGVELSAHERAALRQRYAGVTVADLNAFLERLPRDMLFVMRTFSPSGPLMASWWPLMDSECVPHQEPGPSCETSTALSEGHRHSAS